MFQEILRLVLLYVCYLLMACSRGRLLHSLESLQVVSSRSVSPHFLHSGANNVSWILTSDADRCCLLRSCWMCRSSPASENCPDLRELSTTHPHNYMVNKGTNILKLRIRSFLTCSNWTVSTNKVLPPPGSR